MNSEFRDRNYPSTREHSYGNVCWRAPSTLHQKDRLSLEVHIRTGMLMPPALRAPAGRPCLFGRSSSTMTGIAFVVAARIQGRRARRIRYRNCVHEY